LIPASKAVFPYIDCLLGKGWGAPFQKKREPCALIIGRSTR